MAFAAMRDGVRVKMRDSVDQSRIANCHLMSSPASAMGAVHSATITASKTGPNIVLSNMMPTWKK